MEPFAKGSLDKPFHERSAHIFTFIFDPAFLGAELFEAKARVETFGGVILIDLKVDQLDVELMFGQLHDGAE